jgi:hypothetical protein
MQLIALKCRFAQGLCLECGFSQTKTAEPRYATRYFNKAIVVLLLSTKDWQSMADKIRLVGTFRALGTHRPLLPAVDSSTALH